jgi:peptidoglycan/LPS O-acetylase OafA/YrhL
MTNRPETPEASKGADGTLEQPEVEAGAASDTQTRPQVHRPELDGLRGIAVLAVMAYHYGLQPIAPQGFLGVDIFFVLSGFLITSILAHEWQRSGGVDWRRFYVRRAFRLLPAFWVMIVILSPRVPTSAGLLSLGYLINWSTALHWFPVNYSLGHTWSLAVEWQFYLLWPAIVVLALRRRGPQTAALLALSIGLASAVWRAAVYVSDSDWSRVWHATDTHADGLLIGSALGVMAVFYVVPLTDRLNRLLWTATVGALMLVAVLIGYPGLPLGLIATGGIPLLAVAMAIIIARVAIYPSGVLGRVLSFGPLVRVGVISYGLYLWHVPIRVALNQDGPVLALVCAVLTFLAAGASYRYAEKPFLRAKLSLGRAHSVRSDPQIALVVPNQP